LRAYLEYQNPHVWIAPIRNNGGVFSLGLPRQITNFSLLKSGSATPVTSVEYQPAWEPAMGLSFVTNRDDATSDRIPDAVGKTTSIYTLYDGLTPEADGAPIIYSNDGTLVKDYLKGRNLARKETFSVPAPESFNEEYPSYNPSLFAPSHIGSDLIYQVDLDKQQISNPPPTAPLDPTNILHDIWETQAGNVSDGVFQLQGTPSVTPRLTPPGTTVKIQVKPIVRPDFTSIERIAEVDAVIKDPDQKVYGATQPSQSNAGLITYVTQMQPGKTLFSQVDNGVGIPVSLEADSQTIDSVPLYDDGPDGGHGDAKAGDGIFTNLWVTPSVAHDYYIDVAVRGDRALQADSPLAGGFAFDYFDNVWGFSTRRFEPHANLLLVSDHTAGQSFLNTATGRDALRHGYPFFPTESYYTERAAPAQSLEDVPRPVYTWPDALSLGYSQALGSNWAVLGLDSPYEDDYDIWRTQCRDSFPSSEDLGGDAAFNQGQSLQDAINYYLPHNVPGFTANGSATTIKYADRAVVWAAPYAGDVTMADIDSISNPSIQQMLANYLNQGGRMLLSGQDVAWNLTHNGQKANDLLNNYFHVQYQDDADNDIILTTANFAGNRHVLNAGGLEGAAGSGAPGSAPGTTGVATAATDQPISNETWITHWKDPTGAENPPTMLELPGPLGLPTPFDAANTKYDAAWNQVLIDGVTGAAGNQANGSFTQRLEDVTTGVALGQYTFGAQTPYPLDQTNPIQRDGAYIYQSPSRGYRTVFFSFGMEGIHRSYAQITSPSGSSVFSPNRPAQVMHNAVCWLRQGGISGTVKDVFLGRPIPGATVIVFIPVTVNNQETVDQVAGAAVTDENGNYTILGVNAKVYRISVSKPGYVFDHIQQVAVHGGHVVANDPSANLVMVKLPPGNIQGTVLDLNGKPAPNLDIEARLVKDVFSGVAVQDGPLYKTVTDSQGHYLIQNASVGVYEVTAKVNGVVVAITNNISVGSNATATANLNITAALIPTQVTGKVLDANGQNVSGVTVTATDPNGTAASATTNNVGNFAFSLKPGTYTFAAANAAGVKASQVVIVGATPLSVTLQFGSETNPGMTITLPAGLNMVSLPDELAGADFQTLLQGQTPRVAAWDGAQYQIYPNSPANAVQSGMGYFVNLASSVTVNVPVSSTDNNTARQVALKAGWNLIGDPFAVSVPLANLRVVSNGSSITLAEAANQQLLSSTLWTLSGGNYVRATALDPGIGYWIFSQKPLTLSMTAPPSIPTNPPSTP
jgi:hypothetical protein